MKSVLEVIELEAAKAAEECKIPDPTEEEAETAIASNKASSFVSSSGTESR